ncbi:hypothetical protein [Fodinicola acaciae]|uniref:hypothetical protein n=1 Tax=Fodinicola acaciae TaxID=2681555 RepID=UPI0013D0AF93|nr:hypothetical protein [Fodinicola acaciae]
MYRSIHRPIAAPDRLYVDAAATLRHTLKKIGRTDTAAAQAMRAVLTWDAPGHWLFLVVDPTPGASLKQLLTGEKAPGCLVPLQETGPFQRRIRTMRLDCQACTYEWLWHDDGRSYASDHRALTLFTVARPILPVEMRQPKRDHHYDVPFIADPSRVTGTLPIVRTGLYVLAEVGEFNGTATPLTVAEVDPSPAGHPPESWYQDKVEQVRGLDASTCRATCTSCGRRWIGIGGQSRFVPHNRKAEKDWYYQDAMHYFRGDGTIACPECATGRVRFWIT